MTFDTVGYKTLALELVLERGLLKSAVEPLSVCSI